MSYQRRKIPTPIKVSLVLLVWVTVQKCRARSMESFHNKIRPICWSRYNCHLLFQIRDYLLKAKIWFRFNFKAGIPKFNHRFTLKVDLTMLKRWVSMKASVQWTLLHHVYLMHNKTFFLLNMGHSVTVSITLCEISHRKRQTKILSNKSHRHLKTSLSHLLACLRNWNQLVQIKKKRWKRKLRFSDFY